MISLDLTIALVVYAGLFMSVVIHEMAHAVSALWFGDDTARRLGRITLNPLSHIDPVMTILVPAVLLYASGGTCAFGGAKPVPVNPFRLRNPRHDMMWIAAAGPISNVLIAVILACGLNLILVLRWWDLGLAMRLGEIVVRLVTVNLVLAAFNLVPVPPLDGSKIVVAFLPESMAQRYLELERGLGLLLVFALVFSGALGPLFDQVELMATALIRACTFVS